MIKILINLVLIFDLNRAMCPTGSFEGIKSEYPDTITCYWYWNDPNSWSNSYGLCQSLGWYFASIHDALTNKFLQTTIQKLLINSTKTSDLVWLGGGSTECLDYDYDNCLNFNYAWVDGSFFDYQNFAPGHQGSISPDDTPDALTLAMNITTGQWYAMNGTFSANPPNLPYLCWKIYPKNYTMPKCPQGTFSGVLPEDCYMIGEKPLAWQAAENDCSSKGGHLVSIHNIHNNDIIRRKVEQLSDQKLFWIGADSEYDDNGLGKGYWQFVYTDLTLFDLNNCPTSDKYCTPTMENQYLAMNSTDGLWYMKNSGNIQLPYVCKVPSITQ